MDKVFIANGSGYSDDVTFNQYTVIREPLPDRESRVLHHGTQPICYRAYSLKLAVETQFPNHYHYLLIRHGGGSYVMRLHVPKELIDAIAALPDPQAYAILHAIYNSAYQAEHIARQETAHEYSRAFLDGRLKKSRKKQGHQRVYIEPATPSASSTHSIGISA